MVVSDLYPAIIDNLMGRAVDQPRMAVAIRKSVLEFTENYKFGELQTSGPVVQLVPNQPNYDTVYFTNPSDGAINVQKVNSFFMFSTPFIVPQTTQFIGSNSGYNLGFKTIDRLEVLLNISSMPTNWTRYNNQVWIAAMPDKAYNIYMRYQHEHPFPNAGTPSAGTDTIYMPDNWQEIVEYAASQRLAQIYNLSTKASEFNQRLLGDSKFQETNGIEGQPGLIFQRTSQEMRDQTTTVKRFRLRMTRSR